MNKHRARKRFGQNFLQDDHIVGRIVDAVDARGDQRVVEIGPGQGAITHGLLATGAHLHVIELDRDLVPGLEAAFGDRSNFALHQADALRFDFASLVLEGEKLKIVGNLPYNISTPLLFHLLSYADVIEDMHFMLQREVVNRLAATPGNKAWGKLGVMAQYYCDVEALFEVPPAAFNPQPKVVSAIVRLTPRPEDQDQQTEKRLRRVVTAAFAQRRKTLRNTLRDLVTVQQLEELGIAPSARAETLNLQQFMSIGEMLNDETDDQQSETQ